jgi:hypothetical protein
VTQSLTFNDPSGAIAVVTRSSYTRKITRCNSHLQASLVFVHSVVMTGLVYTHFFTFFVSIYGLLEHLAWSLLLSQYDIRLRDSHTKINQIKQKSIDK